MNDNEHEHWEGIARTQTKTPYRDPILAEYKKRTYLALISRWVKLSSSQRILKTDLFAEAFNPEQFLFELPAGAVLGIDIAAATVQQAKREAGNRGRDAGNYLCADVRSLPLRDNSIDLVISDSTLDHFAAEKDISAAIKELGRVLVPGGTLVLTIDNKHNLTYPPYWMIRAWMKLRLAPYFIGRTLSLAKLTEVLDKAGVEVNASTAILHYPHPDSLVRWTERCIHALGRGRGDDALRRGFARLETLQGKSTRYLTGRYLALKATKRVPG